MVALIYTHFLNKFRCLKTWASQTTITQKEEKQIHVEVQQVYTISMVQRASTSFIEDKNTCIRHFTNPEAKPPVASRARNVNHQFECLFLIRLVVAPPELLLLLALHVQLASWWVHQEAQGPQHLEVFLLLAQKQVLEADLEV